MTIQKLILYAENRLEFLNIAVATAIQIGDVERLSQLEAEVIETEETLSILRAV